MMRRKAVAMLDLEYPSHPWEVAHPTIPDAAMNYDTIVSRYHGGVSQGHSEPECSPHPFDVLAIYALYQAEPAP